MSSTTSEVGISCSCGSTKFEMLERPQASDIIKCAKCGASGRYGEVIKEAQRQITSAVEKQFKDAFRKAGFR